MSLLAIIITLLAEQFLGSMEALRSYRWFERYTAWLRPHLPIGNLWDGPLGVITVLALPSLIFIYLFEVIHDFSALLGFVVSVLVLLYTIGPRYLKAQVEAYLDAANRGDQEATGWHAAELLGDEMPSEPMRLNRAIMEKIFYLANSRLFASLFWFVLLGPLGALLYRLSVELEEVYHHSNSGFGAAVWRLRYLFDWPSARVCGLAYALGGSFVDARDVWMSEGHHWEDANRGFLVTTGMGALRCRPDTDDADTGYRLDDVRESLALVQRTLLVYLALLSILILAGWS